MSASGFARVFTPRLVLRAPDARDVPDLFALYSDPVVWRDDPTSRQEEIAETERMVERWRGSWTRDGLGIWVAESRESDHAGAFVGVGGCFVRHGVAWNLGFRLRPPFWRRGLAQEIVAAATNAARAVRPDLPVTAYLLRGNARSQRATERARLRLVWSGPDAGNRDPAAVRLLFADRDLPADAIDALVRD